MPISALSLPEILRQRKAGGELKFSNKPIFQQTNFPINWTRQAECGENAYLNFRDDTMTLSELNQRFGINNQLKFSEIGGGLLAVEINNSMATASIALQGAHLMTYQPHGHEPVIWLSKYAKFAAGKSIRGGVPICWPWFGAHTSDAKLPGREAGQAWPGFGKQSFFYRCGANNR